MEGIVSALYCKVLIILGLAFPMAEVISNNVPRGFYQLFYVYLFMGSLAFLLFISIDLLRTKAKTAVKKRRSKIVDTFRRKVINRDSNNSTSINNNTSNAQSSNSIEEGMGVEFDDEERLIPRPKQIYGSFYIRMGAVCEISIEYLNAITL